MDKGFNRIRKERDNVNYWDGEINSLFKSGLYDDGRWNNEGKFGKGKKRYWNKISGKWVGKRYESYLSNRIWFYEFEFINEKFIVELFRDSKDEFKSFKYIDRVGYFVCLVYLIGLMWRNILGEGERVKRGVYLSQSEVIGILGSDWRLLIKKLIEIEVIDVFDVGLNKKDRRKKLVNYRINIDRLGKKIGKKYIENKSLEKFVIKNIEGKDIDWDEVEYIRRLDINIDSDKLNKIVNEKYDNKLLKIKRELEWGSDFMSKEDEVEKKLFLSKDGSEYKRIIKDRYYAFADMLDDIKNGFINKKLFFRDEHGGRYYNVINSLDKEFRKELKLDGDEVCEIDMRSMYVSCLMYMFCKLDYLNSELYKKYDKEGRKIEKSLLDYYSKADAEENLKKYFFKWKRGNEFIDEEECNYVVGSENWWVGRKELWSEYYKVDIKNYDWGKVKEKYIDGEELWFEEYVDLIKNENDYYDFMDEVKNVFEFDLNKNYDNDWKDIGINYFDVNSKILSFKRSDNLLKRVNGILFDSWNRISKYNGKGLWKLSESYVDDKGKIIKGDDWLNGMNYESFINVYGKRLYGRGFELEVDDFKVKILKDKIKKSWEYDSEGNRKLIDKKSKAKYKIDYRLTDRDLKKWKFDSKIREKYNNDFNLYEEKLGKWIYLKPVKDFEVDYSVNYDFRTNEFINRFKNLVFNDVRMIDYYNYLMVNFSWGYREDGLYKGKDDIYLNYNRQRKDWGDRKVFNRDFYKMIVMRVLFSKSYLSESFKNLREVNVLEMMFGKMGYEIIKDIKSYNLEVDEYLKPYDNDKYKNISKILGVIEVDVIEYLVNRYFKKNNREYIRIFDGFLIKKKNYWRDRVYLNLILKYDVGKMFDIR